jgi:hypothetical protein
MVKLQLVNITLIASSDLIEQAQVNKISLKSVAEKNGKLLEYHIKFQKQR